MKKLGLFAILLTIFNLSSLLFLSPIHQNISDSSLIFSSSIYIIIWGISSALYFLISTLIIYRKYQYLSNISRIILILACIGMIVSTLVPYESNLNSINNLWHIRIAMLSTAVYILQFAHFMLHLQKYESHTYMKMGPLFFSLVGFNLIIFIVLAQVTTILEICFVISMSWFLFYFIKKEHLIK